jgi:hypothetical protein
MPIIFYEVFMAFVCYRGGFSLNRDWQQGFDAMISGQTGKVILDWTHIA